MKEWTEITFDVCLNLSLGKMAEAKFWMVILHITLNSQKYLGMLS